MLGSIAHSKKFEVLTHATVTRIMSRFPPPIRDIPELVSSSPYFDLAELVIILIWLQPDRACFIQTLFECATDRLDFQLLRSSPNAPHNEQGIVPTS